MPSYFSLPETLRSFYRRKARPEPEGTTVDELKKEILRRLEVESQLAKAKELAEKASLAKTRFLANMSHEIRTPLGLVMGFADLLADAKDLPPNLKEYTETIKRNGQLLLSIINDILDMAKIESGHINIDLQNFATAQFALDIEHLFKLKCNDKGLVFSITMTKNVPAVVRTDGLKLKQIVINLINNAIKFTDEGGIAVMLDMRQDRNQQYLVVQVTDTGRGINALKVHEVFELFKQGDPDIGRQFGGSGIGLNIARLLAAALGGYVDVVWTQPGRGSSFEAAVLNHPIEREDETKLKPEPLDTCIEIKTVLVVDDVIENLKLAEILLNRLSIEVTTCSNPEKAIELACTNHYDLILLDIQMPELSGFDVLKRIRKHEVKSRIWALTAHSFREEVEQFYSAGFQDYIAKPIDFSRLSEKLRRRQ